MRPVYELPDSLFSRDDPPFEPPMLRFDGFPLTGLIGIRRVSTADDICVLHEPVPEWVAVLRRPIRFGTKVIYGDVEEVRIPPQVVCEMQGHDRNAPIVTLDLVDPDLWRWVTEEKLNWAAEVVAARYV